MMPPDWRSTRRVSELRTEPLWGLQCDRSESQAAFFIFCGTTLSALHIAPITACKLIDRQRIHCTTFLKPLDDSVGKLFRGKFSTNVAGLLVVLKRAVIGGANMNANCFQLRHIARDRQMIQHHHRAHQQA